MNIDPKDLLTFAIPILSSVGSYYALRERVNAIRTDLADTKKEAREARELALKAHGADDSINTRIGQLERSFEGLKSSQAENATRVEESNRRAVEQMQGIVSALSREVRDLFDRFHELDKNKISTDQFEAVKPRRPEGRYRGKSE